MDYLKKLSPTRRMQLVGVAFIPFFILQAMNIMSWIVAEPIEHLEFTGLDYDAVPEEAKSFYIDHGNIQFNNHGVIGEEPFVFLFWVALFIVTFGLFVLAQNYVKKLGD